MARYLLGRLLHSAIVVLLVSMVVFGLVHLSGDPVALLVDLDATAEDIALLRQSLGFDRPLPVQYLSFLQKAVTGDFGRSLRHQLPAMELVVERLPATLWLTFAGLAISLLIALPVGFVGAVKRGTVWDRAGMILALAGQSMPSFAWGILLIIVFAVQLKWLPASGGGTWRHLVLPALTVGAFGAALTTRVLRSTLLEVLRKDFVRTARAKGLGERIILLKHVLKNAALPVITLVGLQMGDLIGGSVITETVFSYPGMGLLAVQAIRNRDIAVVQAFVAVVATTILLINLAVDLLYALIDPRVRYE